MDVAAFQTKRNQHSYCLFFPCCCIRPELNHEVVPSHIKSGLESLRDQCRINFGRRCRQAGSGNDSDIKITHTLSGNVQEHWVTSWKLALNPGSKSQISTTLLSYAMETALLFMYLDLVSIKMSNLGLSLPSATVNFNNPIHKLFLLNQECTKDMAIHNPGESSSELLYFSRQLIVNHVSTGSISSFEEFLNFKTFLNMLCASMLSWTLGGTCFHFPFTQGHFCEMLLMKL